MSRFEYLKALEEYLIRFLTRDEVNDIIRDYSEYFSIGENNGKSEQEISSDLGDPKTVARQIISELRPDADINFEAEPTACPTQGNLNKAKDFLKTSSGKILLIIALVLTAPVWFSILGTVLGFLLSVFGVLFGLIGLGGICVVGGVMIVPITIAFAAAIPGSVIAMLIVLSIAMITGGIFLVALSILLTRFLWRLLVKLKAYIKQKQQTGCCTTGVKEAEANA